METPKQQVKINSLYTHLYMNGAVRQSGDHKSGIDHAIDIMSAMQGEIQKMIENHSDANGTYADYYQKALQENFSNRNAATLQQYSQNPRQFVDALRSPKNEFEVKAAIDTLFKNDGSLSADDLKKMLHADYANEYLNIHNLTSWDQIDKADNAKLWQLASNNPQVKNREVKEAKYRDFARDFQMSFPEILDYVNNYQGNRASIRKMLVDGHYQDNELQNMLLARLKAANQLNALGKGDLRPVDNAKIAQAEYKFLMDSLTLVQQQRPDLTITDLLADPQLLEDVADYGLENLSNKSNLNVDLEYAKNKQTGKPVTVSLFTPDENGKQHFISASLLDHDHNFLQDVIKIAGSDYNHVRRINENMNYAKTHGVAEYVDTDLRVSERKSRNKRTYKASSKVDLSAYDGDLDANGQKTAHYIQQMDADGNQVMQLDENYARQTGDGVIFIGQNVNGQPQPLEVETYVAKTKLNRSIPSAHIKSNDLSGKSVERRYDFVRQNDEGGWETFDQNQPIIDNLKSYLSRADGVALQRAVDNHQLTSMTDRDLQTTIGILQHVQSEGVEGQLNINDEGTMSLKVAPYGTITLNGTYAGQVISNGSIAYSESMPRPLDVLMEVDEKGNPRTPEARATIQKLSELQIPYKLHTNLSQKAYGQAYYQANLAKLGEHGIVVKYRTDDLENGQPDYQHAVDLCTDYEPDKLLAYSLGDYQMIDAICGIDNDQKLEYIGAERSSEKGHSEWKSNGHRFTKSMITKRNEIDGKRVDSSYLTSAINENLFGVYDKKQATNELQQMLAEARLNDYTRQVSQLFGYIEPEELVKLDSQQTYDRMKALNASDKDASRMSHLVSVLQSSNLLTEDVIKQIDDVLLQAGSDKNVIGKTLENQPAIEAVVNAMYLEYQQHVDKHVGTSIEHFDPNYLMNLPNNVNESGYTHAIRVFKDSGVTNDQLFTKDDELKLQQIENNLVKFDEKNAISLKDLADVDFMKDYHQKQHANEMLAYIEERLGHPLDTLFEESGGKDHFIADLYELESYSGSYQDNLKSISDLELKKAFSAYHEYQLLHKPERQQAIDDSLLKSMKYIEHTLKMQGIKDIDLKIDDHGVVRWHGTIDQSTSVKGHNYQSKLKVGGDIGQIFGIDQNGVMEQRYASGVHKYFVPGTKAYLAYEGTTKTERTRFMSAEMQMRRMIKSTLSDQIDHIYSRQLDNYNRRLLVACRTRLIQTDYPDKPDAIYDPEVIAKYNQVLNKGYLLNPQYNSEGKPFTLPEGLPESAQYYAEISKRFLNYQGRLFDRMNQAERQNFKFEMPAVLVDAYTQFNNALSDPEKDYIDLSDPQSANRLNRVYTSQLYGTQISNYEMICANDEQMRDKGDTKDQGYYQAKIKACAELVAFPKEYARDTGVMSQDTKVAHSTYNGNNANLANHENSGESSLSNAVFFADEGTGSGGNQGRQEHFRDDVYDTIKDEIAFTTRIDPSKLKEIQGYNHKDAMHALQKYGYEIGLFKGSEHNPTDRVNMASKNFEACDGYAVANVSMMTFGGFTAEDSIIVSKDWAKKAQIRGENGKYRPLRAGDKLSDGNGNKGVISLVVDPDMSLEEAREKHIEKEVQVFKDNPQLDLVADPQSVMSRNNTNVVRQAEAAGVTPLKNCGNNTCAPRSFMVTDKAADKDEHVVGDNDTARKYGAFMQCAFMEAEMPHVMQKVIGDQNVRGMRTMRSYMEGLDYRLTRSGGIVFADTPNATKNDQNAHQYDLVQEYQKAKAALAAGDDNALRHTFFKKSVDGKSLEPNVNRLMQDSSKYQHVTIKLPKEITMYDPRRNSYTKSSNTITLLPPDVRDLKDLSNGNDSGLTRDYSRTLVNALKETILLDQIEMEPNERKRKVLENTVKPLNDQIERNYRHVQKYLEQGLGGLDGNDSGLQKKFRDRMMSPKQPNSGTLTAHADPRLSPNEIMISAKTAKKMNLTDHETVILQRDPIQKIGNIRAVDLKISDDLDFQGFAMNPIICSSFDGDFDGDKYGVTKIDNDDPDLMGELEKIRPYNQLLTHLQDDEDKQPNVNLAVEEAAGMWAAIQNGEDCSDLFTIDDYSQRVNQRDAEIKQTEKWNEEHPDEKPKKIPGKLTAAAYVEMKFIEKAKEIQEQRSPAVRRKSTERLFNELHKLQDNNIGCLHLRCADKDGSGKEFEKDLNEFVESGAKGNATKVAANMKYYHGYDDEVKEENIYHNNYDEEGYQQRDISDFDAKGLTDLRYVNMQTQKAMRIKTDYTAIAGALEQRLMKNAITVMPEECSEIAAGFYQNLLQAKHDPVDAQNRMDRTNKMNMMLSGKDPETGKYYEDADKLARDMKHLVIDEVGCKVSEKSIDKLVDLMRPDDDVDIPETGVMSLEEGCAEKKVRSNIAQLQFGTGLKTLSEMASMTEKQASEREKATGDYLTLVGKHDPNNEWGNGKLDVYMDHMVSQSMQEYAKAASAQVKPNGFQPTMGNVFNNQPVAQKEQEAERGRSMGDDAMASLEHTMPPEPGM